MRPQSVTDARCPRCGQVTDTCIGLTDDEDEPPVVLYCEPCDHQWINLANLPLAEPDNTCVPYKYS